MITCATALIRPAYVRAGEYRRPSRRAKPMTEKEREQARHAAVLPLSRWGEVKLQHLPDRPDRSIKVSLEEVSAKPGQLCAQPRHATPAAPPAVLPPVAATPVSEPRAESTVRKPGLSDLAAQTLARYRARYGL